MNSLKSIDAELADAQVRLTDARLALSTANAELLQRPRDEAMRRINGARSAVQSTEAELQALQAARSDALQCLASAERAAQRRQARERADAVLKRAAEREQLAAAIDEAVEALRGALERYETVGQSLVDEVAAIAKLALPVQEHRQAMMPLVLNAARAESHVVAPFAFALLDVPRPFARAFEVRGGFSFQHGREYRFATAAQIANRDLAAHVRAALLVPLEHEEAAIAGVR